MPSIEVVAVSTLIFTCVVWGMLATLVLMAVLVKRKRDLRLLAIGLLTGSTGAVLDAVGRVLRWSGRAGVVGSGVALLLGIAGLVMVVVAVVRRATQRGPKSAPQPETPDGS
ncbi:MAG TPA: hypothetical protein VF834_23400 [Streptosporangiaceae bacterium]